MFIDPEMVEKWFELGYQHNSLIRFSIFDKRVLLSLHQAALNVSQATGTTITPADLTKMAARGWIPLLKNLSDPAEEIGVPLYVPPRIEFLLALEHNGYTEEELRLIAEDEDVTVDIILTTDELAYVDNDLEIVIQRMATMLGEARDRDNSPIAVDLSGTRIPRAQFERKLHLFQRFQKEGIPERYQYLIAKYAFHIRAQSEVTRVTLCEMDRARVHAGYSPFVACFGTWHFTDGITFSATEGVAWEPTIHSALAYMEGETPIIRVPGFVLRGDKIVSVRTLAPRDYEQLWKQHDLDQYLLTWADVQGQRRCLHCLGKLPEPSGCRRRYCSEQCRNASKQKRYRQRHPEAMREAQKRYWLSLEEGV
jgi:hypothetical protein